MRATCRADSAFRGLTIHENGVWRVDDVEAAVKLADEDPVELKYGPRYMVHPLVIKDPYTGLKGLFYNTALFTNFVGEPFRYQNPLSSSIPCKCMPLYPRSALVLA